MCVMMQAPMGESEKLLRRKELMSFLLGELEEAERLQRRACEIRDAAMSPSALTLETHLELARIVEARGRPEEAAIDLAAAIDAITPAAGDENILATARDVLDQLRSGP